MRPNFFTIGIIVAAVGIFGSQFIGDNWDQLKTKVPAMPETLQGLLDKSEGKIKGNSTTVYKWQDADGNWQFGDKPPLNRTFEVTDISAVQSIEMHMPSPKNSEEEGKKEAPQSISPLTPFTNPERVKQLIDDARGVEQLLEDRKQALDKQINNY